MHNVKLQNYDITGVLNLTDAAFLGISNDWGDDAFNGTHVVGSYGDQGNGTYSQIGKFQQTYEYSYAIMKWYWLKPDLYPSNYASTYPDSKLNGIKSQISGGTA